MDLPPVHAADPTVHDATVVPIRGHRPAPHGQASTGRQHGVDYTYSSYEHGSTPLRWSSTDSIDVRLAATAVQGADNVVDDLAHKMAELTGLRFTRGAALEADLGPADIPDHTIAVAFVDLNRLAALRRRHPRLIQGRAFGHCETRIDPASRHYNSAFIAVLIEHGGAAVEVVRDLRHQAGHALGLGHARVGTQLMSPSPLVGIDDFTAGDVRGLQRLYEPAASDASLPVVIC